MSDSTTTALAEQQTRHLKKTLGRTNIAFLLIAAVLSIEVLGQVSGFGAETLTWTVVLTIFFLVLYGLVFAETGFILMTQGSAWMIISDRMQAMAAADGSFFAGFFGRFHKTLGTPIRVNLLSGVVGTVFMLAAMQLTGSSGAVFGVVLNISISTFLLSYLLVIPAAIRLRTRYPDIPRPFRVPGGDRVFRRLGIVCFLWILLGSWVTLFPGTLESLFGVKYDFQDEWGVDQGTFEVFTLGTLAALLILAVVGYLRGSVVRKHMFTGPHTGQTPDPTERPRATVE